VDYAQLDDGELAARACEGREPAFRELLARYERPVFSLVFRMVRNRETAEDVAQEAFVKAFNAIHTYNPSYRFSNWIFKIANNLTIDALRKKGIRTVSLDGSAYAETDDETEGSRIDPESGSETPEEELEALKKEEAARGKVLAELGSQRDRMSLAIAQKLAKVCACVYVCVIICVFVRRCAEPGVQFCVNVVSVSVGGGELLVLLV